MRTHPWLLATLLLVLAPSALAGEDKKDELEKLKQRFKERYPVLLDLKDAGKVGETHEGLAKAVKEQYLDDKANPDAEDGRTVKEFLAAENKDRRRLYELIAEEVDTTPEKVARRDAQRRFEKAEPDHYLKLEEKGWVQKKKLKKDDE